MLDFIDTLNGWVWSPALIYLCLGAGAYFSIRTRFMQVRYFGEMLRLMFRGETSPAGISSFQALTMSLSGRVGTGNIAGVATAIGFGGPGAVFWMWVVAFLGAATAFVESTLGQIYKERDDLGLYRGGPAYYIEKAMGQKWYAWLFACATVLSMGLLLSSIQANSIAVSLDGAFSVPSWLTALGVGAALATIIFGGVKRIAHFAEWVVPFMAAAYILVAIVICAFNASAIPGIFVLIVKSALGLESTFGAIVGLAVQWGVKRGIYSNEAGQGSGPHAAAAAEVSHPAKQGFVQAFSVYVDTLFICTATALVMLSTGAYNVMSTTGVAIVMQLPGVAAGPGFTQAAVEQVAPGWGNSFVAIALLFFAFTTIVAYYYIAETNVSYINRRVHRPWLSLVAKIMVLVSVCTGCLHSASAAWAIGDLGVGLMAWLNIVAILIVQRPALLCLRDYERQKRLGGDPVFNPNELGIEHAELWHDIRRKNALHSRAVEPH